MGLGTASGGFRIIQTMGFRLTHLKPVQGFAAELSASSVILTASFLGMPISSTHLIAGGVMGVGSAKKFSAVNWALTNQLVLAWILTIPGAAFVSALFYYVFSTYF
jgi:PiT family inorganic phosphate transporter